MENAAPTRSIALVTGANKGIGLAIARQLAEKGFSVWLGCRDPDRGRRAADELRGAGLDAHPLEIDVTSDESVAAAAVSFSEGAERLDALVNNAGVSLGGMVPASQESVERMRATFEVNAFGPVRVTQAFLPLLRKSKAARVVMMSSGLGSIGDTLDMTNEVWPIAATGYAASKSALNMFTVKFAKELLAEGIKVNAADPGYTATDLNRHTGHRTVDEAAVIAVKLATLSALGPTGGFFHDAYPHAPSRHPLVIALVHASPC